MKAAPASDAPIEATNWIAPCSALCFSLLVAFLAPLYARAYADAMPAFTRGFLAFYPLWIALSSLTLLLIAIARQFPALARATRVWQLLAAILTLASTLIIAAGLVALFLPIIVRAEAF